MTSNGLYAKGSAVPLGQRRKQTKASRKPCWMKKRRHYCPRRRGEIRCPQVPVTFCKHYLAPFGFSTAQDQKRQDPIHQYLLLNIFRYTETHTQPPHDVHTNIHTQLTTTSPHLPAAQTQHQSNLEDFASMQNLHATVYTCTHRDTPRERYLLHWYRYLGSLFTMLFSGKTSNLGGQGQSDSVIGYKDILEGKTRCCSGGKELRWYWGKRWVHS